MRLLKILLVLIVLAVLGLTGYAYLGDMAPRQQEIRQPVDLGIGASPARSDAAAGQPDEDDAAEAETTDANDQ
ncbi:hypothetical protein SAMN05421538_105109 [Paracoccus isoporae]|uniref:Uncharacterized protein n=1 Tax=Paracoccus isoporae TaxID=591205 RepID=A0A1G7BIE1_9RHOB|nr:hypothetical protein [Paracoccus isoporae]SDE26888.1 hypothetical protein SAMN05421538_105109 [Paracoccus isoporae]